MSRYKYQVEVLKFKPSGKYYDTLCFDTNAEGMYEIAEQFEFDIQRGDTPKEFIYVLTGKLYQSNKELSFGFPILIDGREIKTSVFPPPPKMPTPPPVRVIHEGGY